MGEKPPMLAIVQAVGTLTGERPASQAVEGGCVLSAPPEHAVPVGTPQLHAVQERSSATEVSTSCFSE
jgi:hypothetical protein